MQSDPHRCGKISQRSVDRGGVGDIYNQLPVLLRIQLFSTKLLDPPKQELGEYSSASLSGTRRRTSLVVRRNL